MTLIPVSTKGTEKSTTSDRSSLIVSEPMAMSALLYTTCRGQKHEQEANAIMPVSISDCLFFFFDSSQRFISRWDPDTSTPWPFAHPWTWEHEGNQWFGAVQLLNTCLFVNLFSIQNEPGPHLLPATITQNLKTAVSADCTSEMLIYIRHGTSALLSKSAENWSEVERNPPISPHIHTHHPLIFNVAKPVDYLIKEWQTLEQLIKRQKLVGENKKNHVWPFACENRFDSQLWPVVKLQMIGALGEQWSCFRTRDWWRLARSLWENVRNSGELQWSSSHCIDLSACVSTVCALMFVHLVHCYFSACSCMSFLDGSSWTIWPRKHLRGGCLTLCECACVGKNVSLQSNTRCGSNQSRRTASLHFKSLCQDICVFSCVCDKWQLSNCEQLKSGWNLHGDWYDSWRLLRNLLHTSMTEAVEAQPHAHTPFSHEHKCRWLRTRFSLRQTSKTTSIHTST